MQWNPVLLLCFGCSEVLSEELRTGSILLFCAQNYLLFRMTLVALGNTWCCVSWSGGLSLGTKH